MQKERKMRIVQTKVKLLKNRQSASSKFLKYTQIFMPSTKRTQL